MFQCMTQYFFLGFSKIFQLIWVREKRSSQLAFGTESAFESVSAAQSLLRSGNYRRLYQYLICVFVRLGFAFKKLLLNFSENRCAEVSVVRDAFWFVSKFRLQIFMHAKRFLAGKSCRSKTARIHIMSFFRVE